MPIVTASAPAVPSDTPSLPTTSQVQVSPLAVLDAATAGSVRAVGVPFRSHVYRCVTARPSGSVEATVMRQERSSSVVGSAGSMTTVGAVGGRSAGTTVNATLAWAWPPAGS